MYVKAELIPAKENYLKDAAPIYSVRNAYAMWREYLPENVWLSTLYPLDAKKAKTLDEAVMAVFPPAGI